MWKTIDGWSAYEVSDAGEIRREGRVLKPVINRDGYLRQGLSSNNIKQTFRVHRLVAQAFIPNPENKETVDHINWITTDNRVENLRWATQSEQLIHQRRMPGVSGHLNIQRNGRSWRVHIKRDKKWIFYKLYPTLEEAIAGRDAFLTTLEKGDAVISTPTSEVNAYP